ncbi:MAG: hypothetical protein HY923_00005 [Elusimicrobia bacterium]|nr:hypothetical protein [Elusimicrobiota bacterium]
MSRVNGKFAVEPLTGKSYVFKVKDAYLGRRWGRFAGLVFAYAAAVTVLQALGL